MRAVYYIIPFLLLFSCSDQKLPEMQIKKLDYPSASAVEYYDGKLYVMGDDAPNMIILDTNLNIVNSVSIVLYAGNRIPKDIKPDLEASAIYSINNEPVIFLFGSGSLEPNRNSAWKYNIITKTKENLRLQPLYSKLKETGIEQINIEGAAFIGEQLILVNRGNKGYPQNQLIITNEKFWQNDSSTSVSIIPFETQKDTASFKGISGLCYSRQTDQLIMTVSTENTRSAFEDGAIGKSYLWIVDKISGKLNSKSITADRIIDLEKIDPRFKGQKIESVTKIGETKDLMFLVLVADNDDGTSTIFKMSITRS